MPGDSYIKYGWEILKVLRDMIMPDPEDREAVRRWKFVVGSLLILIIMHGAWAFGVFGTGYARAADILRLETTIDERIDTVNTNVTLRINGLEMTQRHQIELQLITTIRALIELKCSSLVSDPAITQLLDEKMMQYRDLSGTNINFRVECPSV